MGINVIQDVVHDATLSSLAYKRDDISIELRVNYLDPNDNWVRILSNETNIPEFKMETELDILFSLAQVFFKLKIRLFSRHQISSHEKLRIDEIKAEIHSYENVKDGILNIYMTYSKTLAGDRSVTVSDSEPISDFYQDLRYCNHELYSNQYLNISNDSAFNSNKQISAKTTIGKYSIIGIRDFNVASPHKELLEELILLLSFNERRPFSALFTEYDSGKTKLRRAFPSSFSSSSRNKLPINASRNHLMNTFKCLLASLSEIRNTEKAENIFKLLKSYRIALLADVLEVQLIMLHSCLNILMDEINRDYKINGYIDKGNFSSNLTKVIQEFNIEIDDLNIDMKGEKKDTYDFTHTRNELSHRNLFFEGQQLYQTQKHTRNIVLLFERIFLKWIGIDWQDTHLGKNVYI